jgi:dihydrofolate reductase
MSDARKIVMVVAAAENGVIGLDGGMPWRLPDDLKHFKAITMGHPIIMGRRTWEEIGCTPLPGRRNIVLTRNTTFQAQGAEVAHTPEAAIAIALRHEDGDIMIVGGGVVYRLFLDQANIIERTRVHTSIEGDTTFPELDDSWSCESTISHLADDRHAQAFTFERLVRTNS